MNSENRNEIWQVEVGGQVYEAPLADLPEWIGEGSLLPQDRVRKGNLRWIEARKVPALMPFFNARERGEPMPFVQSVTDGGKQDQESMGIADKITGELRTETAPFSSETSSFHPTSSSLNSISKSGFCRVHPDIKAAYICSACNAELCRACPSSYGGTVRICPSCGSLCHELAQVAESIRYAASAAAIGGEHFGFSDLCRAFAYPFKFPVSLFFGSLMFMVFSLGQSASTFGGVIFFGASIFCMMLANMLTFGVLANTVENFTQGRLDTDFMPSFEDFSVWDDVFHPFFLSLAAYITSFGPFLMVAAIGTYLLISAVGEQTKKFNEKLASLPGTQYYAPDNTGEQSRRVQEILERVKQSKERRAEQQKKIMEAVENGQGTDEIVLESENITAEEQVELQKMLAGGNGASSSPVAPATSSPSAAPSIAQDPTSTYKEAAAGILRIAAPVVVLGFIALLWGLLYFPAACAVAGYSRSFGATINPLVGIDTIKRLGGTYVKILLMGLVVLIAAGIIRGFVQLIFLPFGLPGYGNIPATAVGSIFSFYFWVVFWCVLSFALFKRADRLQLYR